jgi:hypothetical protein
MGSDQLIPSSNNFWVVASTANREWRVRSQIDGTRCRSTAGASDAVTLGGRYGMQHESTISEVG